MKKQLITRQGFNVMFSLLFGFLLLFSIGCKDKNDNGYNNGDNTDTEELPNWYTNVPEAEDVVMYSVNPRVFAEQDALKAITERLDEIKALGTNVIWIMPIYAQGEGTRNIKDGRGSPYCVRDYKAVNAEYGTLEDLQNLVKKAHEKGMAVILDWVPNHTSWDNAWIENEGWYTKCPIADTIIHPAGTTWTDVADLNYANHDMRAAMIDAMKYWFTAANIDGYRVDALDYVPETDFLQQMTSELRELNRGRRILMFAEGHEQDYLAYGFDMDFGWNFYDRLKNLYNGGTMSRFFSGALGEIEQGKKRIHFTTNHDKSAWEKTDVQQFNGERGAMTAFVITATLGRMPLIYSTQEIGREAKVPFFSCTTIDWNSNPAITNEYKNIMKAYTSSNVFTRGTVKSYPLNDVVCFTKTIDDKKVAMVAANVRDKNVTFSVPEALQGDWKNMMDNSTVILSETVEMTPYQYYILEK